MSEHTEGRSEDAAPVVVAEYQTELEAGFAKSLLEGEGIECRTVGGITAGFRAEAPGRVRLLVHRSDFERARALLAAEAGEE